MITIIPNKIVRGILFSLLALFVLPSGIAQAEDTLKPYVLASKQKADMADVVSKTKSALEGANFRILGEYSPYAAAHIIVVTNDELLKNAAQTEMGGYGAVQRVSVTQDKDEVQVAFTNPVYMANAYRMKGDLQAVRQQLATALGAVEDFGSEKGLTPEKLRKYHYKWLMPYFDEPWNLAKFGSHDKAVEAVEKGLAAKKGGVSKVYRVDIPGKEQTVFGVHMTTECSGDEYIMSRIDFAEPKSSAHLPYEMLVSGDTVYALQAEFRIAISFPDLSMMGSNSFFSIMCAPDAIEGALGAVVGVKR